MRKMNTPDDFATPFFLIDQPVIDDSGEEVVPLSVWLLKKVLQDPELIKRVILLDIDEIKYP
jgi:hypothetical protein